MGGRAKTVSAAARALLSHGAWGQGRGKHAAGVGSTFLSAPM